MKANYTYTVRPYRGHQLIALIDPNKGNKSITNDIENVVNTIIKKEKIGIMTDFRVIYKDSEGIWDGWDYLTQEFILLQTASKINAYEKLEEYYASQKLW